MSSERLTEAILVRFTSADVDDIDRIAASDDRTRSYVIRKAIRQMIERSLTNTKENN